jgi:hypothetical protein
MVGKNRKRITGVSRNYIVGIFNTDHLHQNPPEAETPFLENRGSADHRISKSGNTSVADHVEGSVKR